MPKRPFFSQFTICNLCLSYPLKGRYDSALVITRYMERIKCDLGRIRDHFEGVNYSTRQIEKIGQSVAALVGAISALDQAVALKGWPRNGNNPSSAKFFLCRGSLIILSEASAEESCKIVPRNFLQ